VTPPLLKIPPPPSDPVLPATVPSMTVMPPLL
jgi:hypothetical protein